MNFSKLAHFIKLGIPALAASCTPAGKKQDKDNSRDTTKESPNIVLILSDDQAWTDYGFMGHDHIQTPNIDRLAQNSRSFTHGYVPASLCRPSLASLITGLYPHQHGILGNDPVIPEREKYKWGEEYLQLRAKHNQSLINNFEELKTLPDLLQNSDYISYQVGKWWEGNHSVGGFDQGMTHGNPEKGGRHGDEGLKIGRNGMDTVYHYINQAVEKDKPFFLWYAPFLPHRPHNPPDSLLQKYLSVAPSKHVAAYWAMCELFDYTCGQLMDFVTDKGLEENTIFIYVCDNGWVQMENDGSYTKNSKRSPYDFGIRTPVMFKWTGNIKPQMDTLSIVSSTDIVPTVLGLLNIEKTESMHGINVLDEEELSEREAVFGEIYAHDFTSIDSSLYYNIVITNPYKLIIPNNENKPQDSLMLFDIMNDPYEKNNLAKEKPEVVKELVKNQKDFWNNN